MSVGFGGSDGDRRRRRRHPHFRLLLVVDLGVGASLLRVVPTQAVVVVARRPGIRRLSFLVPEQIAEEVLQS